MLCSQLGHFCFRNSLLQTASPLFPEVLQRKYVPVGFVSLVIRTHKPGIIQSSYTLISLYPCLSGCSLAPDHILNLLMWEFTAWCVSTSHTGCSIFCCSWKKQIVLCTSMLEKRHCPPTDIRLQMHCRETPTKDKLRQLPMRLPQLKFYHSLA